MLKLKLSLDLENKTSFNKEGDPDTGRYGYAGMGIRYIYGQLLTGYMVLRGKFVPGN